MTTVQLPTASLPRQIARLSSLFVSICGNLTSVFYLAALVALEIAQTAAPRANGPFALTSIFFPLLFTPALSLILPAFFPRTRVLRAGLLGIGGLYIVTLGIGAVNVPLPGKTPAPSLSVMSWNILADNTNFATIRSRISGSSAGIVGVQELRHEQAADIEADPAISARYPNRILRPNGAYAGIGLLSAYPIVESGQLEYPPVIWARLDVDGKNVLVVNAHPFPGRLTTMKVRGLTVPTGFDPAGRDEAIGDILALIDKVRAPGEPLILLGDFNMTEREPIYGHVAARLTDAHRAAGFGPGTTWKSTNPLVWKAGLGILRIDYQFSTSDVRATRAASDCSSTGSDHCSVTVSYALAG